MKTCSIEGCARKHDAKGFCMKHYHANARHGDPLGYTYRPTLSQRLWVKVDKTGQCWLWTGALNNLGYGFISANGKNSLTHRVSYELANGPIPAGMVIDHICHEPACLRPSHLRAVTQQQNQENRRGTQVNNTSGVRGVSWNTATDSWRVRVTRQGITTHVGLFETLEEAEVAAVTARNRIHTHNDADRRAA